MIIFTDQSELIRSLHTTSTPLHIVPTKFEDFLTYKYLQQWEDHLEMDHEKFCHNIYLYMIWNEKANFVYRASLTDPFESKYFFWTDIGAFREENLLQIYYTHYPNPPIKVRFDPNFDKILLLNIEPFQKEELQYLQDLNDQLNQKQDKTQVSDLEIKNIFQHKNRIGGGIFGGHKDYCYKWWEKYYQVLDLFFQQKQFAGKDQSVMAVTSLLFPDLVHIVKPTNAKFDPWFYLQEYLTI